MNKYLEKVAANWAKIEDRLAKRYHSEVAKNTVPDSTSHVGQKMLHRHPWLVPGRLRSEAEFKSDNAVRDAKAHRTAVSEHKIAPLTNNNDIKNAKFKKALKERFSKDQDVLDRRANKLSNAHGKLDEITERWKAQGGPTPAKRRLTVVK